MVIAAVAVSMSASGASADVVDFEDLPADASVSAFVDGGLGFSNNFGTPLIAESGGNHFLVSSHSYVEPGTFCCQWSPSTLDIRAANEASVGATFYAMIIAIGNPTDTRTFKLTSEWQTVDISTAFPIYSVAFFTDTYNTPNGAAFMLDNLAYTAETSGLVPEPSTWALMLVGFGGIGAGLRRRRTAAG